MKEKIYFRNLHGFRFFAAALVILSHLELFKRRAGLPNIWDNPFFFEAGGAGVDFFFVLSGFLITTLLLKEIEKSGSIKIRKFYMRRILRIWPLYYLIVAVCYFIVPHIDILYFKGYSEGIQADFWSKFLYSAFFMPNVALAFYNNIPYAAPLWSVGVEEQFYLFWPLLILFFPKRLRSILIFILGFVSIKILLILLNKIIVIEPGTFLKIKDLIVATRMECMGIGALGAWLVYKEHVAGVLLKSNKTLMVSLILLPFTIFSAKYLFELHHIIFSVFFLIIIVNGATNTKTPINLEGRLFLTLGNISYGLYLWHSICIGLLVNLLVERVSISTYPVLFNVSLYAGSFIFSIIVAWLSYKYFELPFLRLKAKYSVIISGTEAAKQKINPSIERVPQ